MAGERSCYAAARQARAVESAAQLVCRLAPPCSSTTSRATVAAAPLAIIRRRLAATPPLSKRARGLPRRAS